MEDKDHEVYGQEIPVDGEHVWRRRRSHQGPAPTTLSYRCRRFLVAQTLAAVLTPSHVRNCRSLTR
jgi:hypothetical protein